MKLTKLTKLFRLIFKEELTLDEKRQEQYKKSLNEITEHFNGVKVNNTLVGRINAAKMDDVIEIKNHDIRISKSVPRPKKFDKDGKELPFENNLTTWFDEIRNEAKQVMNKIHYYEKEEKEYAEKSKSEKQNKALEESRKFFQEYGVLPKNTAKATA